MTTKRLPRPRDPIALAKLIGDIATGQVVDNLETVDETTRAAIMRRPAALPERSEKSAKLALHRPGKRGS